MENLENIAVQDLPGYREAIDAEQSIRAKSLIDCPELICGIEVKPLAFNHILLLREIRSPFICGGPANWEHVAAFLWIISPEFGSACRLRDMLEPFSRWFAKRLFKRLHRKFFQRIRKVIVPDAIKAIDGYINDAYMDCDGGMPEKMFWEPPYYSAQVSVIARMARDFGWSERAIMDMPLKRMFQYSRWLTRQNNPKAVLSNRSDTVRREALDAMQRN